MQQVLADPPSTTGHCPKNRRLVNHAELFSKSKAPASTPPPRLVVPVSLSPPSVLAVTPGPQVDDPVFLIISSRLHQGPPTNIRYPDDFPRMTPASQPPPIPDFDNPPYTKPIGPVFEGDEWDPLVERLEDKVIKVLVACESLARCLNMPVERLRPTGRHFNILALDELTIVEITRDCWWIMYEIISEGLGWVDLLNKKRWLLERLKRNVRQSQPETRWDVPCDILIALGFKDPWLYKDIDEQ